MRIKLVLALLFLGFGTTLTAFEWLVNDFYPYVILTGPLQGTGPVDLLISEVEKRSSGQVFKRSEAPVSRILTELEAGRQALYPTALRTPEAEEFLYFSKPYIIIDAPGVLLRADFDGLSYLVQDGQLDLEKAVSSLNNFRIGMVRQRKYSAAIDTVVAISPESKLLLINDLRGEVSRMLQLMQEDRLSAIVGYEEELLGLLQEKGISASNYRFFKVRGTSDYLELSIAAPRTPWGKASIAWIDSLLPQLFKSVSERHASFLANDSRARYLERSSRLLQ